MLRLNTLGGVALVRDGAPTTAASGWRRQACLALVAAGGVRGIGRETLAALVWPESAPDAARHSLNQTLSTMRHASAGAPLFVGTTAVCLNPTVVEVDVWELEAALRSRQLERAAALYRGPFALDVAAPDGSDLQRRLDAARVAYARAYAEALEATARVATARGDHVAAVRCWERRAERDRLDGAVAAETIAAMVAAGQRARALKFARLHEALIRQELEAAPDAQVARWILRLRDEAAGDDAPARLAPFADAAHAAVQHAAERRLAQLVRAVGDRYRVERLVGEGAIVASYAARATAGAGREVEIHVLQPRVAATVRAPHFASAIERAARLAHPTVLPTVDVGADEALLFCVTAPRPLPSLRDRLRHERELPIPAALAIARDLAAALAHAHGHGVCHGDLRPKHVGLTPGGAVVGAFGLVEGIAGGGGEGGTRSTAVTLGSPRYLSPEQLTGHVHADARSDVYAFGAIVFEMLAGEPPFGRSAHPAALGEKLTRAAPRLRERRERVPPALDEIVHACLARVPADRFASGADVLHALASDVPAAAAS